MSVPTTNSGVKVKPGSGSGSGSKVRVRIRVQVRVRVRVRIRVRVRARATVEEVRAERGKDEGEAGREAAADVVSVLDDERDDNAARAAEQNEEPHEVVKVVQRPVRAQGAALAPLRAHQHDARQAGERAELDVAQPERGGGLVPRTQLDHLLEVDGGEGGAECRAQPRRNAQPGVHRPQRRFGRAVRRVGT
eukprot:scaffold63450_cov59-Phaeocystis_antarctica.AAC.4